jgi:Mrp family chromosome partitioning ATPase/uncharacterized protein involved in exopolysaccharide biosynthesis
MDAARASVGGTSRPADPVDRTDVGNGGGSPATQSEFYDRARRALRGRYGRVVGLGLIGAILGGGAGWKLGKAEYQSEGVVRIASYRTPADRSPDQPRSPQFYEQFMKTQEALLASRRILSEALSDPEWQATGRGTSRQVLEEFATDLSVRRPAGSELLQITYADEDPAAAAAGVKSVVDAYVANFRRETKEFEQRRLDVLLERQKVLTAQLEVLDEKIRSIVQEFGTINLDPLYDAAAQRAAMLQSKAMDVRLAIAVASAQIPPSHPAQPPSGQVPATRGGQHLAPPPPPTTRPSQQRAARVTAPSSVQPQLTVSHIARTDSLMHEYVAAQGRAQDEIEMARARGLGDGHPEMERLRLQLEQATARVERYAQEYRSTQAVIARYPSGGPEAVHAAGAASLDVLRSDQAVIDEALENTSRQMARISVKCMELAPFKAEADKLRSELDAKRSRKELIETERAMGEDVEVISDGEVPLWPFHDTRRKYLGAGTLAGGCLPIGVLLLFGVLNRRYRYSDEAATDVAATASAPLLGILPSLCDRLDDSEHAASAAQCIHQIRAVLQVSRPEAGQGVYLVTSSTPGEGKTSVAVSLALSFAASGARTLLVDCDFVGQSITRGFGIDARPGLRDALVRGTVRGFAHRTGFGPCLVGVGTPDVLDAAVVSSIAIRRLLLDARRYFDAIIVDSGPILGSIEATAVAPEVDGVIFAVSRGQQPALAEKAIRHLQAIGATIAGFIFNRAAAKDFGGWTQSSSLRSFGSTASATRAPLADSGALARFGPLVRAVASLMPGGRSLVATAGGLNSAAAATAAVAPTH